MTCQEKTLVISSDGLLGQSLKLLTLNESHFVFTSRRQGTRDFYLNLSKNSKFNFSEFNAIIYNIQSNYRTTTDLNLEDLQLINTLIPTKLAQICASNSIHFTYFSTGSVYEPSDSPMVEESKLLSYQNASPYVKSKLIAEKNLLELGDFLIFRPFFLCGPNASPRSFLPNLINKILTRQDIYLNGMNGIKLSLTPIEFAAAISKEYSNKRVTGIFNLASNQSYELFEIASFMCDYLNVPINYSYLPATGNFVADVKKLKSESPEIVFPKRSRINDIIIELCKIELSKRGFKSQK